MTARVRYRGWCGRLRVVEVAGGPDVAYDASHTRMDRRGAKWLARWLVANPR